MEMKDKEKYCNLKNKRVDSEEEKELSNEDDTSSINNKASNEYTALLKSEKIFMHKINEHFLNDEFYELKNDFIIVLNNRFSTKEQIDSYCKRLIGVVGHKDYKYALKYIHDCALYSINSKVLALPRNFEFAQERCGSIIQRPNRETEKVSKDFIKKMQRKYRDKFYMLTDSHYDRTKRIEGKIMVV
jgi:hypothetical protein